MRGCAIAPGVPAGSAISKFQFLSMHKVCSPPVKRCEPGAIPGGGAILDSQPDQRAGAGLNPDGAARLEEHVLGCPPFSRGVTGTPRDFINRRSGCDCRFRFESNSGGLTRVGRFPAGSNFSPAWCKSSTSGSQPECYARKRSPATRSGDCMAAGAATLGALPGAGAPFPSIAQKQSTRPITGRPGSITSWRDHSGCVAERD